MTLITHRGQHPYKHKAQEVTYSHPIFGGLTVTAKDMFDYFFMFGPPLMGDDRPLGAGQDRNTAVISNPPTRAELVSILGEPSKLREAIIDSGGEGRYVVRVYTTSEQKDWYFTELTKAV